MTNDKKMNILTITLILLALLGSIFLPEYKIWFNILALASFLMMVFYQSYVYYKAEKEWKKYLIINVGLCVILGFLLFY